MKIETLVKSAGTSTRVHEYGLVAGIQSSPEFAKKGLAQFAANVGTKCGHGCAYCSASATLRMHPAFGECEENPFKRGYAIVDPDTATRVERDAANKRDRGLVQLCTTTDAWAPEAQAY
jgi:DNA repair photolyase